MYMYDIIILHVVCLQASFWEHLSKPESERFFQEIHNRFQEAQQEIKNSPMGLVVAQGEVCVCVCVCV